MGVEDVRDTRHECEKHSSIVRHVENKDRVRRHMRALIISKNDLIWLSECSLRPRVEKMSVVCPERVCGRLAM